MPKRRPAKHRVEDRLAHPSNDLVEGDWRQDFDVQLSQVRYVSIVGVLHPHVGSPWRERIPTVADQGDPTHLLTDRLEGPQHPLHWAPAGISVSQIENIVIFFAEVQGHLPPPVGGGEQKRSDA